MKTNTGLIIFGVSISAVFIVILFVIIVLTAENDSDKADLPRAYKTVIKKIGQGPFTCPEYTHSKSDASSQCVVPLVNAKNLCDAMDNCGGYSVTTNANHLVRYPATAILYGKNKSLDYNIEWTTYQKP